MRHWLVNHLLFNRNPVPPTARSHLAIPAACRCALRGSSEGSDTVGQYWTVLDSISQNPENPRFWLQNATGTSNFEKILSEAYRGPSSDAHAPVKPIPGFRPTRPKKSKVWTVLDSISENCLILSNTVQRKNLEIAI